MKNTIQVAVAILGRIRQQYCLCGHQGYQHAVTGKATMARNDYEQRDVHKMAITDRFTIPCDICDCSTFIQKPAIRSKGT